MAYLSSLKNQQNCCRPTCRCHYLGYSVPPALHRTVSPNFCARRSVMMILKLIRNTCQAACHGKTEHGIFVKFKKPAKLLSSYLPVSPSRVLRAPGTSPYRISKFLRSAQRYDDFKLIRNTCQAACHGKTEHGIFVKFKKTSKTAVVLLAGVTISGTPCPRHFTVPFGAEAPSDHVVQAWAIPPPSWGLLSQWHRQETTTPETNGASSARTQRHS